MKTILLVIGGVGDRPDSGGHTPLSMAEKPAINGLARKGRVGLLDIGYEKGMVNPDFGLLNVLGCYSKEDYPGRAYLDALGLGLEPEGTDICIAGSFATLSPGGNIKDRRAGGDETGLDSFCRKLDGTEIDGVEFTVRKSTGNSLLIALKSGNKRLSGHITTNDPLREGVPLPQVSAKKPEAKFTASVLNRFLYRSIKLLSSEPENRDREAPANAILLSSLGSKKTPIGFEERFGLKGCCIAGAALPRGIGRFIGMETPDLKGATGMPDTDLMSKAQAAMQSLKESDFVWLHVNGADALSHKRKREEKARFMERVDQEVVGPISGHMPDIFWIITSSHSAVSLPGQIWKADEHIPDPVPVLVSGGGTKPENNAFTEAECLKARMRFEGNDLLPLLLRSL